MVGREEGWGVQIQSCDLQMAASPWEGIAFGCLRCLEFGCVS